MLVLIMLIMALLFSACSSSRYGRRKTTKKKRCGNCPSWTYVKPAPKGADYEYGKV